MYITRLIDKHLNDWKVEKNRKPLLLRGARQIGKSTTIKNFGKSFKNFAEVNFDEMPEISSLFEGNLDVVKIVERLSIIFNMDIEKKNTLLFFDEIQSCPKAINSLRYFYEKMPHIHIIATGSLLEFALEELATFGVGRIKSIFMYGFSFDEFLMAMSENKLLIAKKKANANEPLDEILHKKLLDYLFTFILIGGMPDAIKTYVSDKSLLGVQDILSNLNLSFQADFSKYKKRIPVPRLVNTLNAVAMQSGGKFTLAKVVDTNNVQAREALHLLQLAGLIMPIIHSSANGIPIGAEAKPSMAKMMIMDTGLFQNILGLSLAEMVLDIKNIINKGALAECFWGLEYIKYQSPWLPPNLYYWHREARNANAEVDFVIQKGNLIIPIEIKSSNKGSMQSLHLFIKEKKSKVAYRFSLENFGLLNEVAIMPLYSISSLF
jgi:uncharacterized protein